MNREPASSRKRAALYARVSSSKQQEEGTIESQLQRLVDYAEKHDLEIPDGWIFQDNGISGCAIQRPALDSLRDLVASGSPDLVVMYHPDRLARKYVYQVLLLDEFAKNGVQVAFCNSKNSGGHSRENLRRNNTRFAADSRWPIRRATQADSVSDSTVFKRVRCPAV